MIDFELLDELVHQISGLDSSQAKGLIKKNQNLRTKREKWMASRFLSGYYNEFIISDSKEIFIVPTSDEISRLAMETCKLGIEALLDDVGLDFDVKIQETHPEFSKIAKKRTKKVNETKTIEPVLFRADINKILENEGGPIPYICFIDNADFFEGQERYITGNTARPKWTMVVLERALTKGRILDDLYLTMTHTDKVEYMEQVSAHETYHLIGKLLDLTSTSHLRRGLAEDTYCLGYSKFKNPPHLCEGCRDGIISLWYGYECRTNKKFLKNKAA